MSFLHLICSTIFLLGVASRTSANIDEKDWLYIDQLRQSSSALNSSASTNTYSQAYTYGQTHPTRDGESW